MDDVAITPDRRNFNDGTERGDGFLEKSLRRLGAGRSILIDKDGEVIAGNKTFEKAKQLGMDVLVVKTHGNQLIAVQRDDLDLDGDDMRALEMALADNRVSEVNQAWNAERLQEAMFDGLQLGEYFMDFELQQLFSDEPEEFVQEPELTPEPKAPIVSPGETWNCGPHQLEIGNDNLYAAQKMLKAFYDSGDDDPIEERSGETYSQRLEWQ